MTATGATVTAPLSGLAPFTTYHYRLVASDCTTAACQARARIRASRPARRSSPRWARRSAWRRSRGGSPSSSPATHRFTTLAAGRLLPLGTTRRRAPRRRADRRGDLELVRRGRERPVLRRRLRAHAAPAEHRHRARAASATTPRARRRCRAPLRTRRGDQEEAKRGKHYSSKVVNQVFGKAHGQFKTRGHYATAADEGTGWRTSDRCDGTQIAVTAGKVTRDRLRAPPHDRPDRRASLPRARGPDRHTLYTRSRVVGATGQRA